MNELNYATPEAGSWSKARRANYVTLTLSVSLLLFMVFTTDNYLRLLQGFLTLILLGVQLIILGVSVARFPQRWVLPVLSLAVAATNLVMVFLLPTHGAS